MTGFYCNQGFQGNAQEDAQVRDPEARVEKKKVTIITNETHEVLVFRQLPLPPTERLVRCLWDGSRNDFAGTEWSAGRCERPHCLSLGGSGSSPFCGDTRWIVTHLPTVPFRRPCCLAEANRHGKQIIVCPLSLPLSGLRRKS